MRRGQSLLPWIAVSGAALLTVACEIDPPPPAVRYTCSIQVSPTADPELVIELGNFNDDRFVDEEGELLWDYFQCLDEPNCPDCGFEADEITIPAGGEMDDHWSRLVATRIAELAAEDPNSDFARFDLWCQVPDTRACRPRQDPEDGQGGEFIEFPECTGYAVVDQGLPLCDDPPPPASCLEIDCDGAPCEAIEFGGLAVGREATRTVTLSNCGAEGDPIVIVSALRLVPAIGTPPQAFLISDAEDQPSCLPTGPDEERLLTTSANDPENASCAFDVTFAPEDPQPFRADLRFRGAVPQHEIELTGVGASGTAAVAPERVCIDDQPGQQCFGQTSVLVTNTGPGHLLIEDILIPEPNGEPQNFQLVPPEGPALPALLEPNGPGLTLEVQYCNGDPRDENARIEIATTDPVNPTTNLPLSLRADCTQPGG